jgi:hypothetical protein
MGGGLPREMGAFAPFTQSHGGGRRGSAWGGCGSARSQAVYERGDACAAGMTGGAAAATPAAATTSAKPPRKRKRGFSTLR